MPDAEMLEWLFEQTISDPSTGCAVWIGGCNRDGYGHTSHNGKHFRANRLVWVLTNGELEPGQCVLHRCDNPPCIRLEHLFLGTHNDNMADRAAKGRTVPPTPMPGEAHPGAKLTQEQVNEIKRRYEGILGQQRALAREFGVSYALINRIILGKCWRNVTP